jgi:lysophospholipase L1-like esterase
MKTPFLATGVLGLLVAFAGSARAQTAAYSANVNGPFGSLAINTGMNIGHTFSVSGTNLQIVALGVYDYIGDGLVVPHTVTLFANVGGTYVPITGGSTVVPFHTTAPLNNGYRYHSLPSPISLPPGNYAAIAYSMNGGGGSDAYSDYSSGNNTFNGGLYLTDTGSVYELSTNPSPVFPGKAGGVSGTPTNNLGCVSFTYNFVSTSSVPVSVPVVTPSYSYVNVGSTTTLTASAFGTPPISYQWYYGNSFTPIAGATNSPLTLSNIQPLHSLGNEGAYSVSAQNALAGPFMSANPAQASVIVLPPVPPVKIMPLGDSITYGMGAPGGYRAPLYQLCVNTNFNVNFVGTQNNNPAPWQLQVNHEGHSGLRIDQIYSAFLAEVNSISAPDIILLMIGTNDYGQNYDTANATNRLDQLITLIATNQPNAKLFVANLTLRTDSSSVEMAIEATFNPFVPGLVATHAALGQHVYFVDIHSVIGASDLIDTLHPNQTGYDKMAAAWFQAIAKVVPPVGSTNATVSLTSTNAAITYDGVPGFSYLTQRSTNLNSGNWVSVSTNTIPTNGILLVTDGFGDLGNTPPVTAFYRLFLR